MTDAQRQIEQAAVTCKAKGLSIVGYRPAGSGAKYPDGSLVLSIELEKVGNWAKMCAVAKEANEAPKSTRGAVVRERQDQGSLL